MRKQQGVMLLEALIGILIFSLGILAVVGLQAASISASNDAKYRSDANLLASKLVAQMWVSNRTPNTLQANFQGGVSGSDGAAYTAWLGEVTATFGNMVFGLPPMVSVVPQLSKGIATSSLVTVTLQWRTPNQLSADTPHKYDVVVQIAGI